MECFYPNGDQEDGLFPCDPKAAVSACCRTGDVCISNGFCFSAGLNALVRRGCTDQSFNSSVCASECLAPNYINADTILTPCDNYGSFCCGQDRAARSCCDNGNGTIRIPAGTAIFPDAEGNTTAPTVTVLSTLSATVTSTSTVTALSGDWQRQQRATIGSGAGVGAALFVVSALLAVAGWRLWKLDKELRRLGGERV